MPPSIAAAHDKHAARHAECEPDACRRHGGSRASHNFSSAHEIHNLTRHRQRQLRDGLYGTVLSSACPLLCIPPAAAAHHKARASHLSRFHIARIRGAAWTSSCCGYRYRIKRRQGRSARGSGCVRDKLQSNVFTLASVPHRACPNHAANVLLHSTPSWTPPTLFSRRKDRRQSTV